MARSAGANAGWAALLLALSALALAKAEFETSVTVSVRNNARGHDWRAGTHMCLAGAPAAGCRLDASQSEGLRAAATALP